MTNTSKKQQKEAIELQQYTPRLIAGTCGNCKHMECVMELPLWMQKQPGVWSDDYKQAKYQKCGIGGFPVKKLGSCSEHAFATDA